MPRRRGLGGLPPDGRERRRGHQDLEGTADGPANPRVNVLALARTQIRTVDPLLLELSLGLTANPVVEGYSFDDHPQAWEGSVLGPFVGVALGTSIE